MTAHPEPATVRDTGRLPSNLIQHNASPIALVQWPLNSGQGVLAGPTSLWDCTQEVLCPADNSRELLPVGSSSAFADYLHFIEHIRQTIEEQTERRKAVRFVLAGDQLWNLSSRRFPFLGLVWEEGGGPGKRSWLVSPLFTFYFFLWRRARNKPLDIL